MKKQDIILDFTSLLDVTLIIIFFFVLFSNLDSQQNKIRTDEKVQELETSIQRAQEREAEADELSRQLENEINIVKEYSDRQASNVSSMLEFNRSNNIKMILDMKDDTWNIRVIKGENVIATIKESTNVGSELKSILSTTGYTATKTLLCEFVFDGSLPGTASAYRTIKNGFKSISDEYKYFYLSETDLSVGGE